jgi:Uncharacterised protein family UPF0047
MKVYSTSFTLSTGERTEISDITKLVRDAIQEFAVTTGIALINTLHTTCALFINEFQSATGIGTTTPASRTASAAMHIRTCGPLSSGATSRSA